MLIKMGNIDEITKLCRLCLVKDQVNVSIFKEQGDTQEIIRKISALLPVKISKEDKLPKKICDGCLYKLDLLYQFRTTCVSAEKQLQVWINELNNSDSNESEAAKVQPAQANVKQEEVEVPDVSDNTDSNAAYLLDQQLTYEGDENPFNESQDDNDVGDDDATNSSDDEPLAKRRRKLLGEVAQSNEKITEEHLAVTKLEHESDGDDNVDDPEPNFVSVGTDDDQQPGPSGLNKNVEIPCVPFENNKTVENVSCTICNLTYTSKESYIKHLRRCLTGKHITCGVCQKIFKTSRELKEHEYTVHSQPETLKCDICGNSFITKMGLKVHMDKHLNEETYDCEECDKKFDSKRSLEHHVAFRHRGVKYKCEKCQLSFATINYLKTHVKMHDENFEKSYWQCPECDKTYISKKYFKQHVQWHKNPNMTFFICEVCGKSLSSSQSLKDHALLHTGERPYKCKLCEKSFNKAEILKLHMRTHTKVKPFVCNICGKRFSQKPPLTIHMRYHSGVKPFSCELCHKSFYTKTLLKTHSKTHGIPLSCL